MLDCRPNTLTRIGKSDIQGGNIPLGCDQIVSKTQYGLLLTGDDTGLHPIYCYCERDQVVISTDIENILDEVQKDGASPDVSPEAICHLLHHGLVPQPQTVFKNLFFLGIGARAAVSVKDDVIHVRCFDEFPYFGHLSTGNSKPSTQELLRLLSASVARQLDGASDGFLMMSSGKDSSGVALAMAEAGRRDIRCVTYCEDLEDPEYRDARILCGKLGLSHEPVVMDFSVDDSEDVTDFFERSPIPNAESGQIAYLFCLKELDVRSGALIDGTGNDCYMGFLPPRRSRWMLPFTLAGILPRNLVSSLIPTDSRLNYLFFNRAQLLRLLGRKLRYVDTKTFYQDAVDTSLYWDEVSLKYKTFDLIDLACFLENHYDQKAVMLKARAAVAARDLNAIFPYCDRDLINYVFNLPEADRFDREKQINKVLLRALLKERCGYDAERIGKRVFEFGKVRWLLRHRKFVSAEIGRCALWNEKAGPLAEKILAKLETRPDLHYALFPLFMISGWHNHSRYIKR
jgi:asparagine synthetase B (glutamine-hydrolysing)